MTKVETMAPRKTRGRETDMTKIPRGKAMTTAT